MLGLAATRSWPARIVIAALLLCAQHWVAEAQSIGIANFSDGGEITIDADAISYDQQIDALTAEGNVVIRRGPLELRADEVRFSRPTSEAEALGNVTLSDPEGIAFADRMQINLENETGDLVNATLHARKQKYSLSGDLIRKEEGQNYRIENGSFTTCECPSGPPTWSVGAGLLDVGLESYADLKDVLFRVRDVPVFCLPRVLLPITRERQSGLLVPRVGLSNRRGFQIIQPVYWAISKSDDATIGVDIESSARLGLLGEYRYAMSRFFRGTIGASYFNERIRGAAKESETSVRSNPQVPENRWSVLSEHTQQLGSVEGYADLLLVGDDLFLREINAFAFDYDSDIDLRTRPFTESRAGFVQRWNRMTLQGGGVFYQDLVQSDELVLQRAPDASLFGQKYLGLGLLGRLDSRVTNFVRAEGIDGLRADLQPGMQLNLPLGRSFAGSLSVTMHETMYQLNENRMSGGFRGDQDDPESEIVKLPRTRSRETVEVGGELETGLSRVFPFGHLGFDKLKHTIEPRLEYLFIPSIAQDDIMVFDDLDRIEDRSLFTYGVSSRLLARRSETGSNSRGQVVELARFSISQSYDINRRLPSTTTDDGADHVSDIDVALRVHPQPKTRVRIVSSFDHENASFSAATIGLRLLEPLAEAEFRPLPRLIRNSSFGIAYRFVTDDPLKNAVASLEENATGIPSEGIQELDPGILIPLTERIGFRYASRYNIREGSFLENHFGLRLFSACDCWGLDIGVSDKSNPNELEFRAQLRLVGLASSAPGLPLGFD